MHQIGVRKLGDRELKATFFGILDHELVTRICLENQSKGYGSQFVSELNEMSNDARSILVGESKRRACFQLFWHQLAPRTNQQMQCLYHVGAIFSWLRNRCGEQLGKGLADLPTEYTQA